MLLRSDLQPVRQDRGRGIGAAAVTEPQVHQALRQGHRAPGRATPPPQKVSTAPPTPPHSSPDAPRTASHTPARYRSAPPPPYPASLRAQRISGSVGVLISIDSEGAPTNVTITHSSGYSEFDDTARRWILRHWRFHPATRSGIPHPSQVRTSVRFVLH